MVTLSEYLRQCAVEEGLQKIIFAFASAASEIADALQRVDAGFTGEKNVYGEEQLALDVLSDRIVQKALQSTGVVGLIASEELPDQVQFGNGPYAVAYDPLDGSSLVDVNLSVGTIFGIYKSDHFIGLCGDDQIASGCIVYGPKTTLLLTVKAGVCECAYDRKNKNFFLSKERLFIKETGKMFAPGNLRATKFREDYVELMEYWMREQYTLRYSGGMVPDINQIILKGKGIFTYPGYIEAPHGKLRLLVECNPMALLVEQAQGKATDGVRRILEKKITELTLRTPIYIGSKSEVENAENFLHSA
ncbi:fructose-1,6-bisphosphatase [Candidatus Peregrinibacteria bacterium]|nr:fructose-1,6-bisphosphatase [Candidatus Peregrinibacteria bacterium]